MAEQIVRSIPITLDKQRALKCDFNAIALIQQFTGRNPLAGENFFGVLIPADPEDSKSKRRRLIIDPLCLRGTLAALLSRDDPKMTPELAGRLITGENTNEVLEKCSQAVSSYFPAPKKGDAEEEAVNEAADESPLA